MSVHILILLFTSLFLKSADYLIDLGPEGGEGGGTVVATGTPEEVATNPQSYTGKYLKDLLKKR